MMSLPPTLTLPLMAHCSLRSNGRPGGMGGGAFLWVLLEL